MQPLDVLDQDAARPHFLEHRCRAGNANQDHVRLARERGDARRRDELLLQARALAAQQRRLARELAGVRLGYLVGPAALIDEVDKVRPPYNIGALNAEATLFALENASEFARQAVLLRGERARLQRELAATPGVTAFPSEANMILVRVPGAAKVFQGMKSRGVLVKNVEGLHPLLADCLRLTVGTAEENTLMIDALRASLR